TAAATPAPPTAAPAAAASATTTTAEKPWDIVIYVDYELSGRTTTRDALRALTAQAEKLTSYGNVELVVADPAPRRLLAPTSDPKALTEALTAASKINARSRLSQVRREFLQNRADPGGSSGEDYLQIHDTRSAQAEESALIRDFIGRLSHWIGGYPVKSTHALVLVSDGFDANSAEFYAETLAPTMSEGKVQTQERLQNGTATRSELERQARNRNAQMNASIAQNDAMTDRNRAYHPFARQAAAAGWTIFSLRGGLNAELAADASMGGGDRAVKNFLGGTGGSGAPSRGLQVHQTEALAAFAEATGGELVADTSKFATTIDTLSHRVRLTYQVSRPIDGVIRSVDVKPRRAGLVVNAMRFTSASSPDLVAASRVWSLIDQSARPGELPVAAKLALEPGGRDNAKGLLEARVGLEPLAALKSQLTASTIRVTIGVAVGNEQPRVIHQLHPNFNLSKLNSATFTSPMQLPKNADKVAVVIEDLTTGAWGGTLLPLAKNQNVITTAGWTEGTAEPMAWADAATAMQRAQQEKKLIVQCNGCDEKLFADSTLRNMLGAFVVSHQPGAGTVSLLDPWGHARYEWKVANAPDLAGKLRQTIAVAPGILHAGELLSDGDSAEAHFALGFAYLKTQSFADAQKEYGLAETAARAAGDENLAQRAQIQSAAALAQSGKRDAAMASLEKIVKAPKSPSTEAEAWLILGHLRKSAGNIKGAKEAYSNAAARAPQGSELQKVANSLAGSV
ncbi:MAG TPA: hypothetical protein VFN10_01920, partial [Thermoanaerobaculia bacterium]|nr:hypothetical protein [Thermoanaerobaculia bacterium]